VAITTVDGLTTAIANARPNSFLKSAVTAEAVGRFHSYFLVTGKPGVGVAPSVGLNGETVTQAKAGTFPYTDPASTGYLAQFRAGMAVAGQLVLYDRLWQNSGIAVATTTAQAITPVTLPSRDANGATLGADVEAWLECYTATTNAGAVTNTTISYTNSAGTAARAGALDPDWPATAVAGTMTPFRLDSGDSGVRSVQSITLGTSYAAGAVGIVLLRRLATIDVSVANAGQLLNFYDLGTKLYAGSALCMMALVSATAFGQVSGHIRTIEG
jgi:hypothetical protein